MSSTGNMKGALKPGQNGVRAFDDKVRDGVTSLLLASLAVFAVFRFFLAKGKKPKATAAKA